MPTRSFIYSSSCSFCFLGEVAHGAFPAAASWAPAVMMCIFASKIFSRLFGLPEGSALGTIFTIHVVATISCHNCDLHRYEEFLAAIGAIMFDCGGVPTTFVALAGSLPPHLLSLSRLQLASHTF